MNHSDLNHALELLNDLGVEIPSAARADHDLVGQLNALVFDPPHPEAELSDAFTTGKLTTANLGRTLDAIAKRRSTADVMHEAARRVGRLAADRAVDTLHQSADDLVAAMRPTFADALDVLRLSGASYTEAVDDLAHRDPAAVPRLANAAAQLDKIIEAHELLVPLPVESHAMTARIVKRESIKFTSERVDHLGNWFIRTTIRGGQTVDHDLAGTVPGSTWLALIAEWGDALHLNTRSDTEAIMAAEATAGDAVHSHDVSRPGLVPADEIDSYVARMSRAYERATQPAA